MNIRNTFALILLFSIVPKNALPYDYLTVNDLCTDNDQVSLERLCLNGSDIKAALGYILSKEIPDKYNCSFDLKGRIKKEVIKYFVDRYLISGSIDISVNLPSDGQISIITNDQALEVGYYVADNLLEKGLTKEAATVAGKVYLREKIVGVVLWILDQSNIENLLPDAITESELYEFLRKELLRYGVDTHIINKWC